jgi:hypothetical protein
MFLLRGEYRDHAGCARDVEFTVIPHIIAKSAKYSSIMGTAAGCTTSRKILLSCKPKRRNRQTK